MREIKFRVWDSKTKKMQMVKQNDFAWLGETALASPERFIVMQYTNLKIKDIGIYEGDLIKHNLWGVFAVVYEVEGAGFRMKNKDDTKDVNLAHAQLQRCKIIGSIYENPELLTSDKKAS